MIGIILAGGRGERMKSPLPKVLHKICGKPMLHYILKGIGSLKDIEEIIVVVGYKGNKVKKVLPQGIKVAFQKKRLGTADAVKSCKNILKKYKGDVLITCGDVPLITSRTLGNLIKKHKENKADATILTTYVKNPFGYGRILRDSKREVLGIVEEKDCNEREKKIREINSGIYCFKWEKLSKVLSEIKINKLKKEYYLTDAISIFRNKKYIIKTLLVRDWKETIGVDTKQRLKEVEEILKGRESEKE